MHRLFPILAASYLLLLLFGGWAFAGNAEHEAPEGATPLADVDVLAANAIEHAPTLSALRSRLKAANERITAAAAFPDPTLEMTAQEIGVYRFDKNSSFLLEYRQELPYPGKLQSRQVSAKAESAVQMAEEDALLRQIVSQVRISYARIYALDAEKRALNTARELLNALTSTVSARYRAGQADQEALLKVEIESSRLSERALDIESERAQWVAVLNRLQDAPDETAFAETTTLPQIAVTQEGLAEMALKNAAEIAIKAAALRLAESRASVARLDQKPDFMLGVGAGVDGMPQPMVMLRLGIQLPVFSGTKQEPLLRSARFEVEAASQDLREARAVVRAEVRRLSAQYERDTTFIGRYTGAILPQIKAALDAAKASYVSGKGDFSTVVEDFGRWLEATTQLARRESDRFITWAGIELLTHSIAIRPRKGQ